MTDRKPEKQGPERPPPAWRKWRDRVGVPIALALSVFLLKGVAGFLRYLNQVELIGITVSQIVMTGLLLAFALVFSLLVAVWLAWIVHKLFGKPLADKGFARRTPVNEPLFLILSYREWRSLARLAVWVWIVFGAVCVMDGLYF